MADLQEQFDKAVKFIRDLPKTGKLNIDVFSSWFKFYDICRLLSFSWISGPYTPTNDEKLKFYSLFKQATVGPCNTPRPGMLDFVGKAKWDAWNALGDMSKEEAMKQYVEAFEKMEQKVKDAGIA